MYLDTDIILSQIKERDWLKEIVSRKLSKIDEELKTSAITIVECQIVLLQEEERDESVKVMKKIKPLGVRILPLAEDVLINSSTSSTRM